MAAILRVTAARRGLFGGSRAWTIVWALLVGVRLLKRFRSRDEVVLREVLEPGRSLVITSSTPSRS